MRVVQHDIFCRSYFGGLYVVGRTLLQNISCLDDTARYAPFNAI